MLNDSKSRYAAPTLVAHGTLAARTLEVAFPMTIAESANPDLWERTANL